MELFLILEGHSFLNDVQTMSQVFFPNMKYVVTAEPALLGVTVKSLVHESKSEAFVYDNGILKETAIQDGICKNAVKKSIYYALSRYTGFVPKWGILTGIRPAKLAGELYKENHCEKRTIDILKSDFLVDNDKAQLCVKVAGYEMLKGGSECFYAGIPFCPSKCLYCSFTSYPIAKYEQKTADYLECIKTEIESVPLVKPAAVYIGGGTPTSLSANMLDELLLAVNNKFDTLGIEFTVEAGRPDTITDEKLMVMKNHGVNRLSINPQTMNERTLSLIGRNHTQADIITAFNMARKHGFDNINMDLIVGLPEETTEMFEYTMEQITHLNPESITVHTLAVKRASRLKESLSSYSLTSGAVIEEMLGISQKYAANMGMEPYYMYRQKNMLGNFENVGYCKKGFHSIYNIIIMEETHTIYAVGAGAVTKYVDGDRISRSFNVKDVDEYLRRNGF